MCKPIGFGPGADRVKDAFDDITATVQARGGDARIEEDLLKRAHITNRFGVLNKLPVRREESSRRRLPGGRRRPHRSHRAAERPVPPGPRRALIQREIERGDAIPAQVRPGGES